MRLAIVFGTILVAGCVSMSETIAGYSDERLCSTLRAGSSHSQKLYLLAPTEILTTDVLPVRRQF